MQFLKELLKKDLSYQEISMKNYFPDYNYWIKITRMTIFILIIILLLLSFTFSNAVTILFTWLLCIIVFFKQFKWIRNLKKYFDGKYFWQYKLLDFIIKNKLYQESSYGITDSSAVLAYKETEKTFIVYAIKYGDLYARKLEQLDLELSAMLNLKLIKKNILPSIVEYHFQTINPERQQIYEMIQSDDNMKIKIFDSVELSLFNNYSSIISGASGSGKSYLIYNMMAQFASKTVKRKIDNKYVVVHAKLYLHDNKMSDLYKHAQLANFPENYFGTTVADAFRMVREVTEEMEKRKVIYNKSSEFDKTLLKMGYEPILLIIDEYPSLTALFTKKQREEFDVLIGNLGRLSRQLSIGMWLVCQQANSDAVPTSLKTNLLNRFFMGQPDMQSSQMMFGRGANDLPRVSEIGEGIASIDGKEPVSFLAPMFKRDVNEVIQPVLQSVSKNYRDRLTEANTPN